MKSEGYFLKQNGPANEAFELRPFEINISTDEEVIIEVEAFGLNYADVMARRGLYQDAPKMPCIIGYEVVGRIVELGDSCDRTLLGQRVSAFCRFGGYARHAVTKANALTIVGEQSAGELLACCTQGVTAYYMANDLLNIHNSDTVLIHAGAGGVGTMLIQLCKLAGATVIAKVGNDQKKELALRLGADYAVNYRASDYLSQTKEILGESGLDVSFNPVAGDTFKKDMSLLGAGGRMVLFGGSQLSEGKWGIFSKLNFVRKMGLVIPVKLMMGSKNIIGVNMLRIADEKPATMERCLTSVIQLYMDGKLNPLIGGIFKDQELQLAHELLESGNSTGKIAVIWDDVK